MSEGDLTLPGRPGEHFLRLANRPVNIGSMANPDGKGSLTGQCGDSVEVFLRIADDRIEDIRVAPRGCIHTWVCASAMSELAVGRTLDDALFMGPEEIVAVLGGLPADHVHCARLAVNTLGDAIEDYYEKTSERENDESRGP